MSHFTTKCSCGTVISQCRCFSKDKIETIVPNGCEKCKAESAPAKVEANAKQKSLKEAIEQYFKEAGKGPFHPCGKCFKWKECECPEEGETKEAGKEPEQLAKAIKDVQEGEATEQTAVALKKLHKGEQDQLAVEIKKKHTNE